MQITLPHTPETYFKLYYYAAALDLIERISRLFGSREQVLQQFPFLAGYVDEARALLDVPDAGERDWDDALTAWETRLTTSTPIAALRAAGIDRPTLILLMTIGLVEEDARFGLVFEAVQGVQHRPTLGVLKSWWDDGADVTSQVRRLQHMQLISALNPDAPRTEWILQVNEIVWDVLRGQTDLTDWARYTPSDDLIDAAALIVPDDLRASLDRVFVLLQTGDVGMLIVRGAQHNGRHTLLGAVARALGRGTLSIEGVKPTGEARFPLIGSLALMFHAMPLISFDLAPGETAEIPPLPGYDGVIGIVLNREGGVTGADAERAITLTLDLPTLDLRRRHWREAFGDQPVSDLESISRQFRMTSGIIRRTARLTRAYAALASRDAVSLSDVQQAARTLNRQALDRLTTPIETYGDWSYLAVSDEVLDQLRHLEMRCRSREQLYSAVSQTLRAQMNAGVRALFSGASGTGKTLAAKILASVLQMDLYRLDLSTVVNKYIGETEKNLNRIFARVEELDVILLIDEGDALLTQRTGVHTSNDRYANLETNYLLQRLESFEGIVIVTTNASERIDSAFQRRMDVVVDFRQPDAAERWAIWQLHLPPDHAVDAVALREITARCMLSGGQIRSAVLHATLLALDEGGVIETSHLHRAIWREYRKAGDICPLRPVALNGSGSKAQRLSLP